MSQIPEGMNPQYIREALARAKAVNSKITDNAVPIQWSVRVDYLGDLDFDAGIMSSDEVENVIESARDVIILPPGFQHVVFAADDEHFHVVMDCRDLPEVFDQALIESLKETNRA